MNKIIDYLFSWVKKSNRMAHLKAGAIITGLMFLICGAFNLYVFYLLERTVRADFIITSLLFTSVVALVCTGIAMATVEYIQKKMGGDWDNKDIAAGVLVPANLSVITLIVFLAVV